MWGEGRMLSVQCLVCSGHWKRGSWELQPCCQVFYGLGFVKIAAGATRVLMAAFFVIVKIWRQPRCPPGGEWVPTDKKIRAIQP